MAFDHDDPDEFNSKVLNMEWSMEFEDSDEDELNPFDSISENGKDFVQKLIQFRPRNRLAAEEALNHDWLRVKPTLKRQR